MIMQENILKYQTLNCYEHLALELENFKYLKLTDNK